MWADDKLAPRVPTHGYRSPEWERRDAGCGNSAADTAHSSCPQCGPGSCHTRLRLSPGSQQTQLGRSDSSLSARCSHTLKKEIPRADRRPAPLPSTKHVPHQCTDISYNSPRSSGLGNGETEAQGGLSKSFKVIWPVRKQTRVRIQAYYPPVWGLTQE